MENEEYGIKLRLLTSGFKSALRRTARETKIYGEEMEKSTTISPKAGVAILGVVGALALLAKATNKYIQSDKQLQGEMKIMGQVIGNMVSALGNALAPAIKGVINVAEYAIIILAKLIQLFTDFNALENINNKNLDDTTKKAKAASKALAGFDTLTTLTSSSGGSGAKDIGISTNAMEEFKKKVADVDKIFEDYGPQIKAATIALGVLVGAGTLGKIATFIGGAGSGLLGISGALSGIAALASIAVIVNCVVNGYEQVKETKEFLEKMASPDIQKANQKLRNQLTKIGDITKTQRVNTKATLDLWKDAQNPLNKILGFSEGIYKNIEGQVEGAKETANKYIDIIKNQQISKDEAQQIYEATKDQLQVNLTLQKTYEQQGKDTSAITDSTKEQLKVLGYLNDKYEIVDGKVIDIKNNTEKLNDIKLDNKKMTIDVNGNTKDLENKTNNWFKTFTSGIANWLNTNMFGTALSAAFNVGKKVFGSVLKFDVGTNYVPQDTLAMVHKGEMIVPKKYNPSTSGMGMGNEEVISLLRELNTTLENKEFNGYISANDITNTAINGINQQSRIMGRSVIR